MVKFNDAGQGYWDFILSNCTDEMIKSIENDMRKKDSKIISVSTRGIQKSCTVIISLYGYFVIHSQINGVYVSRDAILMVDFIDIAKHEGWVKND